MHACMHALWGWQGREGVQEMAFFFPKEIFLLLFIVEDLFILLPAFLLIARGGSHFPLLIPPRRPRGSVITLTFHFISCFIN